MVGLLLEDELELVPVEVTVVVGLLLEVELELTRVGVTVLVVDVPLVVF